MSIIYDALKKIEKSNSLTPKTEDKKNASGGPKTKTYLLYILVVCLGAVIANIFLGFFAKPVKVAKVNKAVASPVLPPVAPAAPKVLPPAASSLPIPAAEAKRQPEFPPLVLNGVFFSQAEGYALINNQIVKEGDTVDGAVVKRIRLEEVELEFEGSITKLSTNR